MYRICKVGKVKEISVGDGCLNIYNDIQNPLFLATEVAVSMHFSAGSIIDMLELCDKRDVYKFDISPPLCTPEYVYFVDEAGLYQIYGCGESADIKDMRRYVYSELVMLREGQSAGSSIGEKLARGLVEGSRVFEETLSKAFSNENK